MRIYAIAIAAALVVAACGSTTDDEKNANDSMQSAHHDSTTSNMSMMSDDSSMMGGDMMQQMAQMNKMMVGMLGASDSAYDQRFIDGMVPHHMGGIMMAQDALAKATHPELKKFAQGIIDAQQSEINDMKKWRATWYGDSTITMMMMGGGSTMDIAQMNQRMSSHLGASDADYDDRFIDMMIPHHQGAVMMATDALQKATRSEIKTLSTKIIADQNKEIAQMEAWRKAWYAN